MTDQDKEDIIYKLKDTPELLDLMLRVNPDVMRPPTEKERQEIYDIAIGLISIVAKKYKQEITAGLDKTLCGESGEPPQFTKEANTVWEMILAALLLNPPQDIILTIADRLGYSADKLEQIKAMAQNKPDTDGDFLPGIEPPRRHQKAAVFSKLPVIDYARSIAKTTSKFNRNIGFFSDTDNANIPLDATKSGIEKLKHSLSFCLTHCKSPDGKPQTLTPYDQDVENTVSNLWEELKEGGTPEVTAEIIYRRMNGIQDPRRIVNPPSLKDVKTSIDKLSGTDAKITFYEKTGETEKQVVSYSGHILDVIYKEQGIVTPKGNVLSSWIITRPGLLYQAEQAQNNRLVNVAPALLDLTASGIQLTQLTISIRRFVLDEIFRIAIAPGYEPHRNKFKIDRFFVCDRDVTLTEQLPPDETGRVTYQVKTGTTPAEKDRIRKAKKYRIEKLAEILEHFKKHQALLEWHFVDSSNKKIAYSTKENPKAPREKIRVYTTKDLSAIDGVILEVEKTIATTKRIAGKQRNLEAAERNRHKEKRKNQEK